MSFRAKRGISDFAFNNGIGWSQVKVDSLYQAGSRAKQEMPRYARHDSAVSQDGNQSRFYSSNLFNPL